MFGKHVGLWLELSLLLVCHSWRGLLSLQAAVRRLNLHLPIAGKYILFGSAGWVAADNCFEWGSNWAQDVAMSDQACRRSLRYAGCFQRVRSSSTEGDSEWVVGNGVRCCSAWSGVVGQMYIIRVLSNGRHLPSCSRCQTGRGGL